MAIFLWEGMENEPQRPEQSHRRGTLRGQVHDKDGGQVALSAEQG